MREPLFPADVPATRTLIELLKENKKDREKNQESRRNDLESTILRVVAALSDVSCLLRYSFGLNLMILILANAPSYCIQVCAVD